MYRFFTAPQVWLLQVEREPGELEVVTERLPEGEAPLCFMSPVDAHIEGIFRAKPGLRYYVIEASNLTERWFLRTNGLLVALLHLAWVGQSGRVMLRPSGKPCRFLRTWIEAADGKPPFAFELDGGTLEVVDRLYEQAGLFAWRETSEAASKWTFVQYLDAANLAVRSAHAVTRSDDCPGEELMLFDPEFRQWHAVPRVAVETE
ncbi:MAG TPA: hypothetical protein VFE81_27595 [Paraburkholderia sp.]|nr:hypothetical protein [Paraburkholderia sp.]